MIHTMDIRREILLYIGIGMVFSIVATFPLFQHSTYISNHGDVNRGLIFSGVAKEALFSGQLPLWNPYTCGGGPMLSDLESWFLQPFSVITLPFDEILGMKLSYTLTLFTAFLGFAFLGKRILFFGHIGSLTLALIMAFGGYITQHIAEGYYVWISSAWIPWFLLTGLLSLKNIRWVPVASLMLAFMFGSGSMHMVVYSLFFLGLVFLCVSSEKKMYERIGILLTIVAFFLLLAAIKLWPAFSLLQTEESRPGFTLPIHFLPRMLLSRGLVPPVSYNGILYRFGEFGNYIGYLSLVLACIPFIHKRKQEVVWGKYKSFFLASAVMLIVAFTSLPITHGFISHITDLFRIPSRVMIFPVFGIGILAAYGIEKLSRYKKVSIVSWGIFCMLAVDLLSNDYWLLSRMFPLPLPELHIENKFMRVRDGYTTEDETYYRAGYIDFLEKRGTNGLCRFYQEQPHTSAINKADKKKPDRGEVYLEDTTSGTVRLLARDTNSVKIYAKLQSPTNVFVNMNHYPGWHTDVNFPVHAQEGLIAITVPQGEHFFTLAYQPKEVLWGIGATLLGIVVGILWFLKR